LPTVPMPVLNADQRRAASAKAVAARQHRAKKCAALKHGEVTILGVLEQAEQDDALGAMRVSVLLESLPRVGPQRAADAMIALRIAPSRRVRGLGRAQRAALLAYAAGRGLR
jgi:GNAT superfamily N-acetyltransferase